MVTSLKSKGQRPLSPMKKNTWHGGCSRGCFIYRHMATMKSLLAWSLVSPGVLMYAFVPLPFASKIRVVSTTKHFVRQKFNVEEVTSQVDATLQAAEKALETKNVGDTRMEQEIEKAVLAAKRAIQIVSQPEENDDDLIDADALLGESSEEVIEWLSQGLLDSESFQALVEQRKEEALIAKQQQAEQTRILMEAKVKEARRLQKALKQKRQRERFSEYMTIGLGGTMVGGAIGLYAWHAIPEYLGDHVTPLLPTFLGGGIMGCGFIVASTFSHKPKTLP
jgi:hypothetical protein